MRLSELVRQAPPGVVLERFGEADPDITDLEYDSRRITPGALFFAVEGFQTDGHDYLDQALERGARGVVSTRLPQPSSPLPWVRVSEIRKGMAVLADRFHGCVSQRLPLLGITGTNGKTTTAFLAHSILGQRAPSLLLGTVWTHYGGLQAASRMTTPEAIDLQRILSKAWDSGCRSGVLEASSHALHLERLYGCRFPVAVFTNLTRDHLDYHDTLDEYFQAKCLLFQKEYNPAIEVAVINGDDPASLRLPLNGMRRCLRFGCDSSFEVHPVGLDSSQQGSRLELDLDGSRVELSSPVVGEHNIQNIMAAASACWAMGCGLEEIQQGVASLACVPGRFERVQLDHPASVYLDYAHTPDALENVLRLCRKLEPRRLICVFGCGGDRDRAKRPLMGEIATRLADYAIITSDNPRSEPALRIVEEILSGIPSDRDQYETVIDRRSAIRRSLELSDRGDLVLLAGKGHENYQEIRGERFPFDEREVIREVWGS